MGLRIIALYAVVAGLSIYAWKDWYKSLCGLILLMAVIHHEDMPSTILGIQGLNTWNVLFAMIFLAWAANRRREGLVWDMPRHVSVLLLMYLGVIVIGVLRAVFDRSHIEAYPLKNLISEELVNSTKWVLPGGLLFDGCRTRKRAILALICLLAVHTLIAGQIINRMPWESALGGSGDRIQQTRLRVCDQIGYSAAELSTVLAGAFWGILAALPLVRRKGCRIMVFGAAGVIVLGQALTGGRAGYAAWLAIGIALCLLKWRKYLLLAPAVLILIPIIFPGTTARMCYGFGQTDSAGRAATDDYKITSGRTLIWPYVIDKISESPIVGFGRLAMNRTGLADRLMSELNESFPHPHNIYLETLLDNGVLGSVPIFLFWGTVLAYSARLFRSDNHLYSAVGGLALSSMLAQLFAGIGGQHFYPRESTFCVWAAMLFSLRVYVEEKRAQMMELSANTMWEVPRVGREQGVAFTHS
jgi:O-antigen ligase